MIAIVGVAGAHSGVLYQQREQLGEGDEVVWQLGVNEFVDDQGVQIQAGHLGHGRLAVEGCLEELQDHNQTSIHVGEIVLFHKFIHLTEEIFQWDEPLLIDGGHDLWVADEREQPFCSLETPPRVDDCGLVLFLEALNQGFLLGPDQSISLHPLGL